jgi:hypothetical protein
MQLVGLTCERCQHRTGSAALPRESSATPADGQFTSIASLAMTQSRQAVVSNVASSR